MATGEKDTLAFLDGQHMSHYNLLNFAPPSALSMVEYFSFDSSNYSSICPSAAVHYSKIRSLLFDSATISIFLIYSKKCVGNSFWVDKNFIR